MLEGLLPDRDELRHLFESAGFHAVASEVVTQAIAPDWSTYADKLSAGGDSVLARLDRQELESGLATIRGHAAEVDDQVVLEPIDLLVFR